LLFWASVRLNFTRGVAEVRCFERKRGEEAFGWCPKWLAHEQETLAMAMCLFLFSLSLLPRPLLLPRLVRQKKVVHPACVPPISSLHRLLRDDGHVRVTDWHMGHKKALRKRTKLWCLYIYI